MSLTAALLNDFIKGPSILEPMATTPRILSLFSTGTKKARKVEPWRVRIPPCLDPAKATSIPGQSLAEASRGPLDLERVFIFLAVPAGVGEGVGFGIPELS